MTQSNKHTLDITFYFGCMFVVECIAKIWGRVILDLVGFFFLYSKEVKGKQGRYLSCRQGVGKTILETVHTLAISTIFVLILENSLPWDSFFMFQYISFLSVEIYNKM